MTEDEAKTKWCPMARWSAAGDSLSSDWNTGDSPFSRCLASGCMAWRYLDDLWRDPDTGRLFTAQLTPSYAKEPPSGYCGLAGKP